MRNWIDPLEHRLALSIAWHDGSSTGWGDYSISLHFRVLHINGGPGNDSITVAPNTIYSFTRDTLRFITPSMLVLAGNRTESIPLKLFDSIEISGGGGNDLLMLLPHPDCQSFKFENAIRTVQKPARIEGGDGNDTISGTSLPDLIFGGRGDDVIFGNSGNDHIFAGAGNDAVRAGRGNDYIEAGEDDDVVEGESGRDTIRAQQGDDLLSGGRGPDQVWGGTGSDGSDERGRNGRSIERFVQLATPDVCLL